MMLPIAVAVSMTVAGQGVVVAAQPQGQLLPLPKPACLSIKRFAGSGALGPDWIASPTFLWPDVSHLTQSGGLVTGDTLGNGGEAFSKDQFCASDYTVEALLSATSGSATGDRGEFDLGLRAYDAGGYVAMYYAVVRPGPTSVDWALLKATAAGTGFNLIPFGSGVPIGATFTFAIKAKGAQISVLVDNVVYGTAVDPESTGPAGSGPALLGAGRIYFGIGNEVDFSNALARIRARGIVGE